MLPCADLVTAVRRATEQSQAQLALAITLQHNNRNTIINVQSIQRHLAIEYTFLQFLHS